MSNAPAPTRRSKEVILEQLIEDVIKSCWTRTTQDAAFTSDETGSTKIGANGAGANVQIILEVDQRLSGCKALVDVGGLKRGEGAAPVSSGWP